VKSEQSLKLRILDYVYFRFFLKCRLQKKRKKSRFFGFSKKKRKKRILELWTHNTTMRPRRGGGGGACLGASLGPRGRGLSEAPEGGLQLSSAGTGNKTSRWTETRGPINFPTSMTGCSPRHLETGGERKLLRPFRRRQQELWDMCGNSRCRNVNNKIKGCY